MRTRCLRWRLGSVVRDRSGGLRRLTASNNVAGGRGLGGGSLGGYNIDGGQVLSGKAVLFFARLVQEHAILVWTRLVPKVCRAVLGGPELSSGLS